MDFKTGLPIDTKIDTWQMNTLFFSSLYMQQETQRTLVLVQMLKIIGHCSFHDRDVVWGNWKKSLMPLQEVLGSSRTRRCWFAAEPAQVRGTHRNNPGNTKHIGHLGALLHGAPTTAQRHEEANCIGRQWLKEPFQVMRGVELFFMTFSMGH